MSQQMISFTSFIIDPLFLKRNLSENLKWIFYFPFIVIPLNLIHIVIFYQNINQGTDNEIAWRQGIIVLHIILLAFSAFSAIYAHIQRRKKLNNLFWTQFFILLIGFLLLVLGISIATVDQYVTAAITPYVIISLAIAITLIIHPIYSILLFSLGYLVFYFSLPIIQFDDDILLSLRVNSMVLVIISIFVSIRMWNINLARFKLDSIIANQKLSLENNLQTLKDQTIQLRELNATKDKFFSIIAHDLRTPFNNIQSITELVVEEVNENNFENIVEYSDMLHKSSQRAMELLTNLMTWAKTQNGSLSFNPKNQSFLHIVSSVIELVSNSASQKSIRIITQINPNLWIKADENMLATILRNLIGNAIKFTYTGGTITISAEINGDMLSFAIQDSGIGMSQNLVSELFILGANTSRSGTHGEASTGLGLHICKEFVEIHGGIISVDSEVNIGTTFTIQLPNAFVSA